MKSGRNRFAISVAVPGATPSQPNVRLALGVQDLSREDERLVPVLTLRTAYFEVGFAPTMKARSLIEA